jgi:hypothetical protein
VIEAIRAKLEKTVIGDPALENVRMGPLASMAQVRDVLEKVAVIATEAECVHGDPAAFAVEGADAETGAFLPPMLFRCADPAGADGNPLGTRPSGRFRDRHGLQRYAGRGGRVGQSRRRQSGHVIDHA